MHNALLDAVDASPIGRRQRVVVAFSVMALVLDGLGLQLLGLVAPALLKDWGLERAGLGPALAAALLGVCVGALLGGWLGDRVGRKAVLVVSTVTFGAAILASGLASGIAVLVALRVLEGLGFGAATPNAFALASEWMPRRSRSGVVGLLAMATPLGGLVGAVLVLWLLPLVGWRGCFLISGSVALVLALLMMIFLMESPGFLCRRDRAAQAAQLIRQATGIAIAVQVTEPDRPRPKRRSSVFTHDNMRVNAGIWLTYFCLNFVAYSIAGWGTVALTMGGIPLEDALAAATLYNLLAVTTAALLGFEIAALGSRRCIIVGGIGAILAIGLIIAFQILSSGPGRVIGLAIIVAMGILGGFLGLVGATSNALMTNGYTVETRASGLGLGILSGRLGGLIASALGGVILSLRGDSAEPFFLVAALIMALAIVGAFVIDRHIPSRRRSPHLSLPDTGDRKRQLPVQEQLGSAAQSEEGESTILTHP